MVDVSRENIICRAEASSCLVARTPTGTPAPTATGQQLDLEKAGNPQTSLCIPNDASKFRPAFLVVMREVQYA